MGIGITSNFSQVSYYVKKKSVSIPNGDRHYLEHRSWAFLCANGGVSIPNGDRHYLEPGYSSASGSDGIVSIPNGDRHYLELAPMGGKGATYEGVSIPNGDRHYLEPSVRVRWLGHI